MPSWKGRSTTPYSLHTVGENEFLWMLLEVDETKVRTETGWPTRLLCKGPPTWQQFVDERLMPLDSLLWSPKGTWGILLDHDRYALAGGSEHFIAALRRNVPAELADRTWPGDLFRLTIDDLQARDWFQRLVAARLTQAGQSGWAGIAIKGRRESRRCLTLPVSPSGLHRLGT